MSELEIFLVAPPGLEQFLAEEAREKGFALPEVSRGGVTIRGDWSEVWRANLSLRGATRVLVRIGGFRAMHPAQLDKRSRKFPWGEFLRPDVPIKVEATCKRSRIYHAGAAVQRVEKAISETLGAPIVKEAAQARVQLKVRIEDDMCTFSLDASGESLHKRGHKQAMGKAPMRETLAALFLRQCGYRGDEPVLDPMCGSGTFVIEAAEIAAGMDPGRARPFAFEQLAGFDATAWSTMKSTTQATSPAHRFHGSDRNAGAVKMATDNAARAGVGDWVTFTEKAVSDITRPDGPPGLVIVNPPYGARIGNRKLLFGLYGSLGKTLMERFSGWRVGVVTSDGGLAKATGLPFLPSTPPVAHGGLKITLHRTDPLP